MKRKIKAVYAEHYGAWWKLSISQWRDVCTAGLANGGHDLPEGSLKGRPSFIKSSNYAGSEGRVSYWTAREDILVYSPLDWDGEDYRSALEELAELTREPKELAPIVQDC